jgi:hypothetical protein
MGVRSSDEVRHEGEWNELEQSERGGVPCNWDAGFMGRHERSECPRGTPGEPAETIRG